MYYFLVASICGKDSLLSMSHDYQKDKKISQEKAVKLALLHYKASYMLLG